MVDNDLYVHVLELKEQILRFAPAKKHDSSDDTYGKGTSSKYGHVKVDNTVQTSENPPKGSAIITYVSEQINTVKTALKSELQSKINIITTSTGITNNTTDWVSGVPSTGTFVKNPDASWPTGTSGIPSGWTVVDAK